MPQKAESPRRLLLGLTPGLIAFSMGQTVLFAVAGPVFREIGLRESQLGFIISASAVVLAIASPLWGNLSDQWGRKCTIVIGLGAYGVLSLAFAFVMDIGLDGRMDVSAIFVYLLLLRLLYAASGAGIQPAAVALMADTSEASDRASAVAVVGAAFGFGMVLGPASVALLVTLHVLAPLYAIAILGLISAIFAARLLPEGVLHRGKPDVEHPSSGSPASLRLLVLGSFLLYAAMSIIQQTMAFNVQDLLGTGSVDTARRTGFLFMAVAVGMLAMQAGLIQWLKPGPRTLLVLGLPLILAGLGLYSIANSFSALAVAMGLMGAGFGLSTPGISAAASLIVDTSSQGRVAGVLQSAMAAGFIVGPFAGARVYEVERVNASLLAVAVSLCAIMVVAFWLFRHGHELAGNESPLAQAAEDENV